MIIINFTNLIVALKNSYTKIFLTIILLLIIGLKTVSNYGVSSDEMAEINMVFWNLDLITKNQPIPRDLKHYGTLFNFSSEAVFQVKKFWQEKTSDDNVLRTENQENLNYNRFKLKHYLTFLLSLVTYVALAGLVAILAGLDYAWLGSIILALFPRFWGHSFFNPKDIPFAAMFTLGTFLGVCLLGYYHKVKQEDIRLGINWITLYSCFYGLVVGLVTGIRIGGFILLFFVVATHLKNLTQLEFPDLFII